MRIINAQIKPIFLPAGRIGALFTLTARLIQHLQAVDLKMADAMATVMLMHPNAYRESGIKNG